MGNPNLPINVSQVEFEDQLRNLNSTLGPVGDIEGAQERRNSQAIQLVLKIKNDVARVELINGKTVIFGKR